MGSFFIRTVPRAHVRRALLVCLPALVAAPSQADPVRCQGALAASAAVQCALENSPELRSARLQLQALSQQQKSAGRILPSHPQVSVLLADRRPFSGGGSAADPGTALNWYLTLSQEIEFAGQRGKRVATVEAEAAAQLRRVAVIEQETAAHALRTFAESVATREDLALAERAAEVAAAMSRYATARAAQELVPSIEADLARAEAARLHLLRSEAEQRARSAEATLRVWLQPAEVAEAAPQTATHAAGSLDDVLPMGILDTAQSDASGMQQSPVASELVSSALRLRADLDMARLEVHIKQAQRDLLRRSRVPNLMLSFTAQSDGFGERVLGGGVSLPLPLPEPLGPSRAGDVAAAGVAIEQAKLDVDKRRRQIVLEVQLALSAVLAAQRAVSEVPSELIARAQTDLWAIAEAIRGGRVSLREALLWQRGLLDLLQLHLRARRDYALARIELRRASGLALVQDERSTQQAAPKAEVPR